MPTLKGNQTVCLSVFFLLKDKIHFKVEEFDQ